MPDTPSKRRADRRVRVDDVAREAGVSPITVSRALSTPDLVRPETRAKVAAAVEKTGYVVNALASSLRSGRSTSVMVFTASLQNPHYAGAVQGALDAFEGSRFHLVFSQTGYSDEIGTDIVESALQLRPAGVMFTGVVKDEAARTALRELGVPIVEMWGEGVEPIDMLVGSSIREAGRMMGEHFVARGYRNIAYCGHVMTQGGIGLQGFREGLASGGLGVGFVSAHEGSGTFAEGIAALEEILVSYPQCDAIFFGSDLLAVGAIVNARERSIAVPERVAIAGYGNLDFGAHVEPTLTSVTVSDYDTGRLAGAMLRKRLEGGGVAEPVRRLSVQLEIRGSTAPKSANS
ncbi:MAG TPA: LacI family DNA-binding transcriptional regulator [Devosia sp.]|nr:LacI family DNA-binding transcriptional regulator [Devosia sp.]